jgi:hypothetical protein
VFVVLAVALLLLACLLWRPNRPFAVPALLCASLYVGARLAIHGLTVHEVRKELHAPIVMASPQPIDPLRWDIVARVGDVYRYGRYSWVDQKLRLEPFPIPVAKASPEWDAARRDPSVRGFVSWMRFPWYEVERRNGETRVFIHDARYAVRRNRNQGFGGVEVVLK